MKNFYFVRHGESVANALKQSHETTNDILSGKGKEQAGIVSKRLKHILIERVVCSTMNRTRETAAIINAELKAPIEFLDILQEVKRPTILEGLEHDDPKYISFDEIFNRRKYEENWRFSDEENFIDRKNRGLRVLEYLLNLSETETLVVAHNGIIKTIVATMLFGKEMSPREYYAWLELTRMNNTGVTECLWHSQKNKWKLMTWNDQTHLG